ncbi:uncharacterized protein [Lolium perenne]|uniref:uncharacterized protein isoform X1 n=1 Tax=Lolium perenne TaxID=4522 RepID=UPI0021EAF600|nr:uncharacterized protein LOC127319204 isoform X3 [Lolium perenne]
MGEPLPALAVGLLGLGSCTCGFIAGATRLKRDDIILQGGECVYPTNPAFALGYVVVSLLLLTIVLITARCFCKCCSCGCNMLSVVGILSTVMAWYSALRAGLLFFLATEANRPGGRGNAPKCYDYVRVGVLFDHAAYRAFQVTFFGLLSGGALHKGAQVPAS